MTTRTTACALALALFAAACTSANGDDPNGKPADSQTTNPPEVASPVSVETAPPPKDDWFEAACALPPEQLVRIARGYMEERSPDLTLVPRAPNFFGSFDANSHSGPWDYVQRVPIVFYGPGFIKAQGEIDPGREVDTTDIAPTLAELVGMEWPADRPSEPLTEALVPEAERPNRPRLVVTVVWDGGGRNVLQQWPDAWPNLKKMIGGGTSFTNAVVGSNPSVTPAVHANIGTGTFPDQHGIVDIPLKIGDRIAGSWDNYDPRYLITPTLADLYDQQEGNAAEIGMIAPHGWHLGMLGHGAALEGGDHDFAILSASGGVKVTNPDFYELPKYINQIEGFEEDVETIDRNDGQADGRWLDNDVLGDDKLVHQTPAATIYQSRVIESLLTNESFGRDEIPDMLFTNFKQIDYVGHRYNMLQPEMRDVLHYTDRELGNLIDFLNEWVGEKQWVIALTADHGSTPDAEATKAWPINTTAVVDHLSEHFGLPRNEVIEETRVTGFWTNREALAAHGIKPEDVAQAMVDMTAEDMVTAPEDLPPGYADRLDERIFSAAWPSERMDDILRCAGASR